MRKEYPGHAKRVMFGVWSFLRQFMYTKIVIVIDDDVDVRDWKDVIWAITTRVDPKRDSVLVEIDADRLPRLRVARRGARARRWASTRPTSGRAKSIGEWGRPIAMRADVVAKIDATVGASSGSDSPVRNGHLS